MKNNYVPEWDFNFDYYVYNLLEDGYKIGYLVTLAGLVLLLLLTEIVDGFSQVATPGFGMFFVIMFGIVVFSVYCIFHDSFFSVGEKGKTYILLCLFVVVANGVSAVGRIVKGTIIEEGKLTFSGTSNLIMATSFLIIVISLVIKNVQDKKEAAE